MRRQYLFRKKVFKLFGGAFHVYDPTGSLVFYSKQKAFKLKEDFRIYADESQQYELMMIKTPQILDFSATYYIQDSTTGEQVGSLKRKGLKSILQDEWLLFSNAGHEIGKLTESSIISALVTRFLTNLLPQTYIIESQGRTVCEIKQHFNPFVLKYTMTIFEEHPPVDRRLLIAAGILLAGIEGRQN